MDKEQINFWLDLEIPLEDFLKEEKLNKTNFTRKIFNRLKHKSEKWFDILSIKGSNDEEAIQKLRDSYDTDSKILNAYCCSWFAHKLSNPSLVLSFTKNKVSNLPKDLEKDDQVLVYLLYNSNKDNLVDLYYEHFLQKIQMETYLSNSVSSFKITQNLTKDVAQKILDKYERKRKNKRQKSKVWWFKEDDNSWTILFRRSRLKRTPIKEVNRNNFILTADLKAFKIDKNFANIYLYSRKEPLRMAKCVSLFAKELANLDLDYLKQEKISSTTKVNSFITKIQTKNKNDLKIIEICFSNFPLEDSPTIILKSQDDEGINNAIQQLKNERKYPGEQNCLYIKLNYKNKKFDIKFNRKGENTGIALNYRGLIQKSREEILEFLEKELK